VPAVRPEFGPTLPELLRPWTRAHPRVTRAVLVLLVLGVGAAITLLVRSGEDTRTAIVDSPVVTFNLIYPQGLVRVAPQRGELLHLRSPPGAPHSLTYAARAIVLPRYRGDINGYLPLYSAALIEAMRHGYRSFALRGEGRVRINEAIGYGMQFQARRGGTLVFGRRLLLFPGETPGRRGVDILLLAAASPAVPNVDAVGNAGPLKTALRSFRFGTERP
jgi:hypothetical protein